MNQTRLMQARVLIWALIGALILWSYWPVFVEMAGKWVNTAEYSHGYLVPVFSAYLLWRSRKDAPSGQESPVWWGAALSLGGMVLHLGGAYYSVSWFQAVSLLPVLWGAVLLAGGRRAFLWSWWAIGFLGFMIPLPYRLEVALSRPLQNLATYLSTYALQTLGWPAFREGNVIVLNEHRIGIVTACNGLGMLILFVALAAAVITLTKRPRLDRALLLASSVPIALAANVIRITATTVLYDAAGKRWGDVLFHDLAGWVMMPLALGMLFLELRLLSWLLVPVTSEEVQELDLTARPQARLEHAQR